jgi:hypothetical protein
VGTVQADGITFRIYSHDHPPPHAHGFYGETSVVVLLLKDGQVGVRVGSVRPANAKKSDLRKIVASAMRCHAKLMEMWEATHG